jgi:peptide chain release factor 3
MGLQEHIDRRRTFAIISHPDAGKTTLTEKLLLYGGAVQLAGTVTQRKNQRASTSDWMELERQRGISISSTVLQFEYRDHVINLLDTPGHKDFSEDTYRVLTAVDAAIMVIDAGKGIETQTRKLFEVCRKRGVPIFTFMNKMDREAIPPIQLLDELESVLGIPATAMNWPLGMGRQFKGVFDRITRELHLFERTAHGAYRAPVKVGGLHDEILASQVDAQSLERARDEIATLDGAGYAFDHAAVLAGELTPVFFGSAGNNFGVQLLLDSFVDLAPGPIARKTAGGDVKPDDKRFSGFVFKIQANMDPRHRDRIYFIRIVSGRFERDMSVYNTRSGKTVRLSNAQRVFARTRETLDEAYAGDVIGIVGNHAFHIGDTLSDDPNLKFDEMPRFPPECFALLQNPNPSNYKRFRDGLEQLLQEGVIQQFLPDNAYSRVPLLGAIGPLQFEVVQYRLQSEYNAESRLEPSPYSLIRWARRTDGQAWTDDIPLPNGCALLRDVFERPVAVFADQWPLKSFVQRNAAIELSILPFPED